MSQRRERLVRRLLVNKSRAKEGLALVEGVRACGEALAAAASVSFALGSPRLHSTAAGRALAARLHDVIEISDDEMDRITDTEHPQGVLLVCEEHTVDVARVALPGSRLLVLDAVQDPGNVGTLVRAAVAFGLDAIVALDGTTDPWGTKAVRASAGTVFRIPVARASAADAIAALSASGLPIYVASAEGTAAGKAPAGGFALVLGNEGAGVREAVRSAADHTVAVPMRGPAESLNVGMAGSILMSDFTRTDA
ncbi:MAG: RNA methyltransferase [Gemmatimonadota bacterium]|nr:RNA methyltransferase [Gemmatimonadota bacterium]